MPECITNRIPPNILTPPLVPKGNNADTQRLTGPFLQSTKNNSTTVMYRPISRLSIFATIDRLTEEVRDIKNERSPLDKTLKFAWLPTKLTIRYVG